MAFDIVYVAVIALLFGITMKTADLLDEHGMKMFKGAATLSGFLWGAFGALLVLVDVSVANIILAQALAFIIRMRIDYRNHAIAVAIIIITFLAYSSFDLWVFSAFFIMFLIFGSLKDYVDDILKRKDLFYVANEVMLYYPIPTFIYSALTGNWTVFLIFLLYTIAYDVTKYYGQT